MLSADSYNLSALFEIYLRFLMTYLRFLEFICVFSRLICVPLNFPNKTHYFSLQSAQQLKYPQNAFAFGFLFHLQEYEYRRNHWMYGLGAPSLVVDVIA